MSIKNLQGLVYVSKYSRWDQALKRRETFPESTNRVFDMHERRFAGLGVEDEIAFAKKAMLDRLVLGSQRALQFGGKAVEQKHARSYNCTTSYVDRPRFFQECFWLLLCGCGTGFSVQRHHVAKLPDLSTPSVVRRIFVAPDTIEGWADCLGVLLASYGIAAPEFKDWVGVRPNFDLSRIRPEGSTIASGSGKAPGPEPLRAALDKIRALLDRCVADGQTRLRPIDVYDIIMHASDAVLAGGVRRSASICLFSPDDQEMVTAKTGNWFTDNSQRGRSNNSAVLLRDKTSYEDFASLMKSVKEFGEPGFVFADSTEITYNPCFHPDTRLATSKGLVRVEDLFHAATPNEVIVDARAGKGDQLNMSRRGVSLKQATAVKLTQRQARVFKLTTDHGHVIKATANHLFPTTEGRKELKDLRPGMTLLLPSGEGVFGTEGSEDAGMIIGMITGDGTFDNKDHPQEAFVDVWEDDFDQLEAVGASVKTVVAGVALSSKARRSSYGMDFFDCTQVGSKLKKRIGGVRLLRWLHGLGVEHPASIKHRVPECVWRGTRDMVRGYLRGLLVTDGSVQVVGSGSSQTVSLRLTQANAELLRQVQVLLGSFGIVSKVYLRSVAGSRQLPDSNREPKAYDCKAVYELIINRPNAVMFERAIGLPGRKGTQLAAVLDARGRNCQKPERFITTVESVEFDSVSDVYCLEQPETNTVIADGVVAGQCVEIGLYPTINGKEFREVMGYQVGSAGASGFSTHGEADNLSGWAFCNLCEINMKACKTPEIFERACRAAAIIGTMQASYTDFDYLGPVSSAIAKREALLGVSMTGMMDSPDVAFDNSLTSRLAKLILAVNEEFAAKIGIRPTARATCVKPAGTTSCILGTSSGIHAHHARRYFRRVQANKLEAPFKHFQLFNPRAVENSVWNPNGKDAVATFCIDVPKGARTRNQVSALKLLEHVKETQLNWVDSGRAIERCAAPFLRHNVSNTITVRDGEWEEVTRYIYDHRAAFAGISILPYGGDLDYPQAPFCAVWTFDEITKEYGVGSLFASGLIVDGLHAFNDDLWKACSAVQGLGADASDDAAKVDWIRRAKQFATRYFEDDTKKMIECLKRVSLAKLWEDLTREAVDVDYTTMVEAEDNTSMTGTAACAGGKCDIV